MTFRRETVAFQINLSSLARICLSFIDFLCFREIFAWVEKHGKFCAARQHFLLFL